MRVGVITHNYPRYTGDYVGIFIEALCRELAREGDDVIVFAPYDPAFARPLAERVGGGRVELCLYRYVWPERFHQLAYGRSMKADLALRVSSYWLSPLMLISGILTVLASVKRTRPDVLHAHWVLPGGFIGAVVSRLTGVPLVVSIPGSDAQLAGSHPVFASMARSAFEQASVLTANSEALRDAVVPLGADLAKFDMIIYGTDPDRLEPDASGTTVLRGSLGIGPDEMMILAVGRMVPKKGFDVLIDAMADRALSERKVIAVFVGNGDMREAWERRGRERGVADRLRWVGSVPTDLIGAYYNAADVLAMPSVTLPADGLNVCVLDAMSCAKPVVGSNVAGNPLAIVDAVTGLLVPERDACRLAQALATLADDPGLRQRMGLAGRQRIEQELGWPVLARRYRRHFSTLADARRERDETRTR